MEKKRSIFRLGTSIIFAVLFVTSGALRSQFKAEEIAQRGAFEKILLTAEIIRSERIGEGVTKPFRLFLNHEGREIKAAWKNPSGMMGGFLEGWQYEIAAYRLDKLIGLNMVPVAVEREFNGKRGALVLWVDNATNLLNLVEKKIAFPESALQETENMKYLLRAWDSLIANDDRTQQNILYTSDWRTIAFDHSRSFRSGDEHRKKLMFGASGLKHGADGRPYLFRRLPRWFVERIKTLTYETIKTAVGSYLSDGEIRAILTRRDLLLEEIKGMIEKQGEKAVLYE